MKKISIIIPTLDRQNDLIKSLQAILRNNIIPDEIIIVEQGDIIKTNKFLEDFRNKLNINIIYSEIKSVAIARNKWFEQVSWDYIFLIDDDLEISDDYIEIWYNYLYNNDKVYAIAWKDKNIINTKKSFIKIFIRFLLFQDTLKKKNIVLSSGQNTVNMDYKDNTFVEWLSGCMVIKKEVLNYFRFNSNFVRWSFWEDVYFSYQIYKKFGKGSLVFLPNMIYNHKSSEINRIWDMQKIRMMFIYRYIFWKNEVYDNKLLNIILYIYSEIWRAILHSKIYKNRWKSYKEIIKTQIYILKNYKKIDSWEIDYNKYILD